MTADNNARPSPRASSARDFSGKVSIARTDSELVLSVGGLEELVLVERSTRDMSMMPRKEPMTPKNLRQVNLSIPVAAPMSRVQKLEVDVRIVVEATVVYCKQAMAK